MSTRWATPVGGWVGRHGLECGCRQLGLACCQLPVQAGKKWCCSVHIQQFRGRRLHAPWRARCRGAQQAAGGHHSARVLRGEQPSPPGQSRRLPAAEMAACQLNEGPNSCSRSTPCRHCVLQACQKQRGCNAWTFCWRLVGCGSGCTFESELPAVPLTEGNSRPPVHHSANALSQTQRSLLAPADKPPEQRDPSKELGQYGRCAWQYSSSGSSWGGVHAGCIRTAKLQCAPCALPVQPVLSIACPACPAARALAAPQT